MNTIMSVGGNNNILLGTGAELPETSGSNQIVLGTDESSLLIQGSLNYHVGANITVTSALDTTPAQFYLIAPPDATAIIITLPAASINKGVTVIFRRNNNANMALVTFVASSSVYPFNGTSGVVTLGNTQYQTQFVCDGSAWYQIYAA